MPSYHNVVRMSRQVSEIIIHNHNDAHSLKIILCEESVSEIKWE